MKLTKISLDDWAGVYDESGKLITEGHSVRWDEVIKTLGHTIESHYIENDNLDEFGNCLPPRLEDIMSYIGKK
jgi:hypothetical protein